MSEDFDFSDDEEAIEIQKKMLKVQLPKISLKKQEINHSVLTGIVQTFKSSNAYTCILDYVNTGSEINAALRENKNTTYKRETIGCLDKYAIPLSRLFPDKDYIILYRTASKPYNEELSSGFLSAANIGLPGFGSYTMKIYVPMSTKVLVADITEKVKTPGVDIKHNVFEFILPRYSILKYIGTKDTINYYQLLGGDAELNERLRGQILEDLK